MSRLALSPHEIGLGLAFGVFVGFIPLLPIQTLWALGLCLLFGGSRLAAMAGAWVLNPFTAPFMVAADYHVGVFLLPHLSADLGAQALSSGLDNLSTLLSMGWRTALVLNAGGVALGIPFAVAAYLLARRHIAACRRCRLAARTLKRAGYGLV